MSVVTKAKRRTLPRKAFAWRPVVSPPVQAPRNVFGTPWDGKPTALPYSTFQNLAVKRSPPAQNRGEPLYTVRLRVERVKKKRGVREGRKM